jgi:hypothetical protein
VHAGEVKKIIDKTMDCGFYPGVAGDGLRAG